MNKSMILLATILLVFGLTFAAGAKLTGALAGVKTLLCSVLPIVVMLAVVLAAILFAVGQLGSAESRAKFHGWATNILIGAITALIVLLLVPWLLQGLMPGTGTSMTQCGGEAITGATSG